MSGVLARASTGSFGQVWSQASKVTGCMVIQSRDASDVVPAKFKLGVQKRGTGGRSSFNGVVATVFGASGYLGRYVCNQLGKVGSQVIIPYRCDPYWVERLRMCGDLGQVLFFPFDLKDDASIRKVLQYSNVAINLIGQDAETKNFSFEDVHINGPARIARIAKECGVEKLIHVSHLNATKDPQQIFSESQFLKCKYEGEMAVREEFPDATIFKPSDMYGEEDRFLNYYAGQDRWIKGLGLNPLSDSMWSLPLWKKGFQTVKRPVYVADVAAGIAAVARGSGMEGKTIECVGNESYYLYDICDYILRILRWDRWCTPDEMSVPLIRMRYSENGKKIFFWDASHKNLERFEREHHTDLTNSELPKLEDVGVRQKKFEEMAYFMLHPLRRNAYYQESMGETAQPEYPKQAEFYQQDTGSVRLP